MLAASLEDRIGYAEHDASLWGQFVDQGGVVLVVYCKIWSKIIG
jgi:hypothetical protein